MRLALNIRDTWAATRALRGRLVVAVFLLYFIWPTARLVDSPRNETGPEGLHAASKPTIARWEILANLKSTKKIPAGVRNYMRRLVRIPGFLVPLDGDETGFNTFLLVPSPGQCIHVPPPPPNNTIYARSLKKLDYTMDPVWIYGRLRVKHTQSRLAPAYYHFQVTKTEPYNEEVEAYPSGEMNNNYNDENDDYNGTY